MVLTKMSLCNVLLCSQTSDMSLHTLIRTSAPFNNNKTWNLQYEVAQVRDSTENTMLKNPLHFLYGRSFMEIQ